MICLRRLISGGGNRSYGIQVARLAGLPALVIERAKQILKTLENKNFEADSRRPAASKHQKESVDQLALFRESSVPAHSAEERQVLEALREIDPLQMTPLAALATLDRLVRSLRQGGQS